MTLSTPGAPTTPRALTLSHCFVSSSLFAPVLLIGEEWVLSQDAWLLGERGRVCYASTLADLCGFEQLYLFLSLRSTVTPLAPAGCGPIKGGGFVPCGSHSSTSGLWQEGFQGCKKQHAK